MASQLWDQYGRLLTVGEEVVVAVQEEIAAVGTVVEINPKFKQVFVDLRWPAGNIQRWGCFKYSIRDGEIYMAGLVVTS